VSGESIRPFYADWAGYNRRIAEGLARLTPEDLSLQAPGSDHWPIWAIAGHMAGTRVFWLCEIFGERGIEMTPWPNGTSMGWEDDLTTPRSADELVEALTSTWQVIEGCLARWTPATLGKTFDRGEGDRHEVHTRQSILLRMINHEAYHVGEISLTLGANGRTPIDLWPGADWLKGVPAARREG
jgi:uncharacterized damage-inducible protein DinB